MEAALQFVDDLLWHRIFTTCVSGEWKALTIMWMTTVNFTAQRSREPERLTLHTKASHTCTYSYFPQYSGTSDDGINANKPDGQANEFFDGLNDDVKKHFLLMAQRPMWI